jgi:probable rRNA maturation factor
MPIMPTLEIGLTLSDGAPPFKVEQLERLLTSAVIAQQRQGEIGVWICSDDEIADLHQRFMGIMGPTDVISFPGDSPYLGDVAVSFETAALQAEDTNQPVAREIAYLVLHGMLHLLGYDDVTPSDREQMLARQDELIEAFEKVTPGAWS